MALREPGLDAESRRQVGAFLAFAPGHVAAERGPRRGLDQFCNPGQVAGITGTQPGRKQACITADLAQCPDHFAHMHRGALVAEDRDAAIGVDVDDPQ